MKKIVILFGDPNSINSEILYKTWKTLSKKIRKNVYFIYPNQAHKYQEKFKNSFQHGGISMEEMMVPIVTMKGKN